MKRNMIIRLVAGLVASLLLVLVVAKFDPSAGKRTDGIYYQVTNIHPDARMMKINGQNITAEEYFYWVDYGCEYITSYMGEVDWSTPIDGELTYADYLDENAINTLKMYAAVNSWAEEAGIALDENDMEVIQANKESIYAAYGGKDAFLNQLEILGISEDTFWHVNEPNYLYNKLVSEFCTEGSSIYPDIKDVNAYAEEEGYLTASILYWVEDSEEYTARENAEIAVTVLKNSSNINETYSQIAGQSDYSIENVTFTSIQVGEEIFDAISGLAPGEVSSVITTSDGYYVAVRHDIDVQSILSSYFSDLIQARIDDSRIVFNTSLKNKVNVATFVSDLTAVRSQMSVTSSQTNG